MHCDYERTLNCNKRLTEILSEKKNVVKQDMVSLSTFRGGRGNLGAYFSKYYHNQFLVQSRICIDFKRFLLLILGRYLFNSFHFQ